MSKPAKISNHLTQQSQEKNREEQLINEVKLLLKTLMYQEEIAIKEIINCLYDIGTTNLVNYQFKFGTINQTLKFITKMSKPMFRMLAWQWFKQNCPDLITEWLQGKVTFVKVEKTKVEVVAENENLSLVSISQIPEENQLDQVKRLHLQVKLLTSILVVIITLFSGSLIWLSYFLHQSHLQTVEKLQNQVKILESSINKR